MKIYQNVKLALKQLGSFKFRTFLTMLGIIIGVFSVILLVTIGEAISKNVSTQLGDMGSNLVSVNFLPSSSTDKFTYREATSLLTDDEMGSPEVTQTKVVRNSEHIEEMQVTGINEDYSDMKNVELAAGRFCSEVDINYAQKVTVIDSDIAKTYFKERNPVGEYIRVSGVRYLIIGVLQEKGESLFSSTGKQLFIPITSAERLFKTDSINLYYIQAKDAKAVPGVVNRVKRNMSQLFPNAQDSYEVVNQQEALDTFDSITKTLTFGLGALAGISL